MSNQRAGKTHAAALVDSDKISVTSLIRFLREAKSDLEKSGDDDAALRFEILADYLVEDYRGGGFKYSSKMIGL
jgi:hypothetical protein